MEEKIFYRGVYREVGTDEWKETRPNRVYVNTAPAKASITIHKSYNERSKTLYEYQVQMVRPGDWREVC